MKMKTISIEEEYKKNPEIKREVILKGLDWLRSQPQLPDVSEFEAILIYHSTNFDYDLAVEKAIKYFTYRTEFTDICSGLDMHSQEIINVYKTMSFIKLPGTTPKGYSVLMWKFLDADLSKFHFVNTLKLFVLFLTTVLYECGTCPGYIILLDLEDASLMHVFKFSLKAIKHGLKFLQEALPVRLKGVETLNFPMGAPLPILKPFIRAELYEILKFNDNLQQLNENIPIEMMPCDYPGGKGPAVKELRADWWKLMNERRDHLCEIERTHRVDTSKIPVEPKKEKGFFSSFF